MTSQRAGHSPRSSSLSLASNDSSTSLLPSSTKLNGSGLRHTSTLYQGPSATEVLEKLLRSGGSDESEFTQKRSSVQEEDLSLEPDFGGLSLQELAKAEAHEENVTLSSPLRSQSGEECE